MTLVAVLALLNMGFRQAKPEDVAKQSIQQAEERFSIGEHLEFYQFSTINFDGSHEGGQMFIIFRYRGDEVWGIFRQLATENRPGVTLLNIQRRGQIPELYLYDPARDYAGKVPLSRIFTRFGATAWYLEGIFDDDKNDWRYDLRGEIIFRGQPVQRIMKRYADDALRQALPYDFRMLHINRSKRPVYTEFIGFNGNIVYSLELLSTEEFMAEGRWQERTKQVRLTDWREDRSTVLTRLRSSWNPRLEDDVFTPDFAAQWDARTDEEFLAKLGSAQEGVF